LIGCTVYVIVMFLYVAWCSLTYQTSGIGAKDSSLLGCDALFLGEQFPKSWRVMVQSLSGVNDSRTTNPVTKCHITEDLNPQEHQNTFLELGCMLRSVIDVLVLLCHLLLCLPQFITDILSILSIYFHPFSHICDIGHSIYKLHYILTYKNY